MRLFCFYPDVCRWFVFLRIQYSVMPLTVNLQNIITSVPFTPETCGILLTVVLIVSDRRSSFSSESWPAAHVSCLVPLPQFCCQAYRKGTTGLERPADLLRRPTIRHCHPSGDHPRGRLWFFFHRELSMSKFRVSVTDIAVHCTFAFSLNVLHGLRLHVIAQ